jgi:citrate lyase synthetase
LIRVLQKPSRVINVVLAGTDRFEDYTNQLKTNAPDVKVVEIPRTDEVSGTVVRNALSENNYKKFTANTPQEIWDMFDELREFIN